MPAARKAKIYAKWQTDIQNLSGDRILGARLYYGASDKPEAVGIQFDSHRGRHSVEFGFLDAMFLLSLLKSIQLDTGFPFPDDPRGDLRKPES